MKRIIRLIAFLIPVLFVWSCIEEYRLDADPPTVQEAGFSFIPSTESDNILNFVGDSDFFLMVWDLGNGVKAEGRRVTGFYPLAGTYKVTLTVYGKGGSATFSQDIIIENTDPTLLDRPVFNLLTGGLSAANGKTWVIDSARAGHLGVGPIAGTTPEFYQARPNEKVGSGMYNTRYTFKLEGFQFDWNTNGLVYLNGQQGAAFPGAFDPGVGDLSAPFVSPGGLNWNIIEEEGRNPILSVTNPGFIGYFTGVRTYEIMRLEENEMFLRFTDAANGALAWYVRLIPAGFAGGPTDPGPDPEPENPNVSFTLNDLIGSGSKSWSLRPAAGAFGVGPTRGSDAFFPNGPNISGDRPCLFNDVFTFNQNGSYVYDAKGDIYGEFYMGLAAEGCQPESNLVGTPGAAWGSGTHQYTFTPGTPTAFPKITVRGTGAFLVLPKAFNGGEYTQGPPRANESVTYDVIGYDRATGAMQLSIDISGNGSVFWNFTLVPTGGQEPPQTDGLRLQDLIGNGTKAWKLKPAAGAFGVGPAPGSDSFFPNGPNISGDRPCLFNDLFIFKENGVYQYDSQGDIYAEDYMGISGGGCQPVANLAGTPGAAWGNGTHQFTFTPATGSARAKITVTGTGAFIVLPKAINGREYTSGPPVTNGSVTYDVLNYNPTTQELTLTIDITNNGAVWWTYVLIPAN